MSVAELIAAAQMGNIPEIQRLLATRVPINGTDARGRTALMHAIMQNKEAVALELLKSPGVDVTTVSFTDGKTVLMLAVEKSQRKVVEYLIEHFRDSLDCAATDNNGESALFAALDKYIYAFPIIKMLVENCGKEIFTTVLENVRGGKAKNPIQYMRAMAQEEVKELSRLDRIIAAKRARGEEPTSAETGMYTFQKSKLDKIAEILTYLESHAGSRGGGKRQRNTRRRRSHSRRRHTARK
jgi:hypothetical protein